MLSTRSIHCFSWQSFQDVRVHQETPPSASQTYGMSQARSIASSVSAAVGVNSEDLVLFDRERSELHAFPLRKMKNSRMPRPTSVAAMSTAIHTPVPRFSPMVDAAVAFAALTHVWLTAAAALVRLSIGAKRSYAACGFSTLASCDASSCTPEHTLGPITVLDPACEVVRCAACDGVVPCSINQQFGA